MTFLFSSGFKYFGPSTPQTNSAQRSPSVSQMFQARQDPTSASVLGEQTKQLVKELRFFLHLRSLKLRAQTDVVNHFCVIFVFQICVFFFGGYVYQKSKETPSTSSPSTHSNKRSFKWLSKTSIPLQQAFVFSKFKLLFSYMCT